MNIFFSRKSFWYSVCNIIWWEDIPYAYDECEYVKIRLWTSKFNMLIEILGNSSSLLVVLLIGLSIYFGIQAKAKNIKWFLVSYIITLITNEQLRLQKKIKNDIIQGDLF